MGAEVSIFDTDIVHRVSTRDCVTLFTIFFLKFTVSSQELHMGRGDGTPGGGMPPGSPNPDPVSTKKMQFSTPVLRPDF